MFFAKENKVRPARARTRDVQVPTSPDGLTTESQRLLSELFTSKLYLEFAFFFFFASKIIKQNSTGSSFQTLQSKEAKRNILYRKSIVLCIRFYVRFLTEELCYSWEGDP